LEWGSHREGWNGIKQEVQSAIAAFNRYYIRTYKFTAVTLNAGNTVEQSKL
jgi:hypothetical protein